MQYAPNKLLDQALGERFLVLLQQNHWHIHMQSAVITAVRLWMERDLELPVSCLVISPSLYNTLVALAEHKL